MFSSIVRNSLFSTVGKLSIKIISFLFAIFIVRWLGDKNYGHYTLVWSYVIIFSIFSDAGLSAYAVREIAKDNIHSNYIASNIIVIRILLSFLTIPLIMVTAWFLGYSSEFLQYALLASTILLLYAIQDPLDAVLQANERFDLAATATIVGQLVFVGTGITLLLTGWQITGLIVAGLMNVFVSAVIAWYLMTKCCRKNLHWQLQPALWPGFIQNSLSFGLVRLWLSWFLKIDIIILSWFWLNEMVGWYSAAYAIILGILVISNAVNSAIYPTLSRQHLHAPLQTAKIYELALKYLLLISLPIAGSIFLLADKVVLLLYGAEFSPTASVLTILIWIVPLMFVSEFLRYVLLAINYEKSAAKTLGFAVILNVVLNLWLIPTYGFLGAAIVAIVSEIFLVSLYVWQLRFELKSINLNSALLKPALVTVAVMIAVYMSGNIPPALQISLGGMTYIIFIWQLRVINVNEYKILIQPLDRVRKNWSHKKMSKTVTKNPLVSVFIPAYNVDKFIEQSINSVLAQSYKHYELIIIDDGSTDNTANILKRYQSHPLVKIHHNPKNMGLGPNWNIGLNLCQGDLIAKLDADDFYEPDFLETVVTFFQQHKEAGMVFSGLNLIYPDGRIEPEMKYLRTWVRDRGKFLPDLLRLCLVRSPTICVRRNCYEEIGNFNEQMSAHGDWEMWVRIAANYPVGFIARILSNYRMGYGLNHTVESTLDGRSMKDLKLWLTLLEQDALPYRLNNQELSQLKWGIYELQMHFAALAAHYKNEEMRQAYTHFAEQVLPVSLTPNEMERMRRVYFSLHKGVLTFRDHQLKQARHHFLQAIKTGPAYCKPLWIWSKLFLTFLGRTKWGILYK